MGRFIGFLVIVAVFALTPWVNSGFKSDSLVFGLTVAGAVLLTGLTVGPFLVMVERRVHKRLAGFLAFLLMPSLTLFFYRVIAELVYGG
jgi:hypothetical protein